jgi:hypothetical protein
MIFVEEEVKGKKKNERKRMNMRMKKRKIVGIEKGPLLFFIIGGIALFFVFVVCFTLFCFVLLCFLFQCYQF